MFAFTFTFIFLLSAAVGLFIFFQAHRLSVTDPADFTSRFRHVDVEALVRLCDAGDRDFVRERLSPAAFSQLERLRLDALGAYLDDILVNTRLVLGACALAYDSGTPEIRANAERLAAVASRVRTAALVARTKVFVARLAPQLAVELDTLLYNYEMTLLQTRGLFRAQS